MTEPVSRSRQAVNRVADMLAVGGPGFRRLALTNSASTAGDALVAIALAGTLFFDVPSAEARANVALYLLLTIAPFAMLAPLLGLLLRRYPTAYRHGLVVAATARAAIVVLLALRVDSLWLYPLAFLLLVLSRLHTVSRSSLLPVALTSPTPLVMANARLAQAGIVAGALVVPIGVGAIALAGPWLSLLAAAAAFVLAAVTAADLPPPPLPDDERDVTPSSPRDIHDLIGVTHLPRGVRLAQLATAGVRLLNGFLLLLLAFALRRSNAGVLGFAALLGAGGAGFFVAAVVSPWLERRLREEPMVVIALAVEAGAAFGTAQIFGVVSAAILAAAAGFAWGVAKFAFDGLLQAALPAAERGVAFTRSETVFAIAWVIGAIVPVVVSMPTAAGLSVCGLAALAAQVVYVSGLLVPGHTAPSRPGQSVQDGQNGGHRRTGPEDGAGGAAVDATSRSL